MDHLSRALFNRIANNGDGSHCLPTPGYFIPKSPGSRQLSKDKPAIPAKSLVLSVTRVKPKDRAWAAIILSLS